MRESGVQVSEDAPYFYALSSAEKSAGFRIWRAGVQIPQSVPYAFLAQSVERRTVNPYVAGSSPAGRAICAFSSAGRAADS